MSTNRITHTIELPIRTSNRFILALCKAAPSAAVRIVDEPHLALGWGWLADVTLDEADEQALADAVCGGDLAGLRDDSYGTDRRPAC